MAGLLNLENGESWMVKNWVFNRFVNRVIQENARDKELIDALRLGVCYSNLNLVRIRLKHHELTDRLSSALKRTAKKIVFEGVAGLSDLEAQGQRMYLDALRDLLIAVEKH